MVASRKLRGGRCRSSLLYMRCGIDEVGEESLSRGVEGRKLLEVKIDNGALKISANSFD